MVLAARILYGAQLARVPGSEFIYDICELAAKEGSKIFVYGAKEEVNRAATETLKRRYDRINTSEAEILFLALGSPKQEKWLATYKHSLENVRVCQGIGGTLDTIAGNVKRAPEIWLKLSLEWLYRLISEPKRIKRQKVLPIFVVMILIAKMKNFFKVHK